MAYRLKRQHYPLPQRCEVHGRRLSLCLMYYNIQITASISQICGVNPITVTDCCPCRSVLSDFQGKEIAATTANSDGWF